MKLRYQLLVAVLLITLTASSFVAGRRFGSLDSSAQGRSGLTRLVSTMLTGSQASADSVHNVNLSPLETFQQVLNYLRRDYAFPIKDERKLSYAAINGMLASLRDQPYADRYSRFLEPPDYRGFLDENEGHFGGIGAEIGMREVSASGAAPPGDAAPADSKGAVDKDTIHCPSCGVEIPENTKYQLIIVARSPIARREGRPPSRRSHSQIGGIDRQPGRRRRGQTDQAASPARWSTSPSPAMATRSRKR
jgi:hypothetical protein